jgi:ABC-type branched-subunit amino acid transport system ATPase component
VIAALRADDIVAGYGEADIVKGVSAEVQAGQILGVIGPNGSGKSTFIKALAGLIATRRGEIRLSGDSIAHLTPSQRVAAGIAYVPQEFNVFPNLTIGENLRVSSEFLGTRQAGREQRERVLAMFPEVAGRLKLRAGYLSGGQRQMLAFACAMMASPRVLLLDEPSAGLAPKLVRAIFERVKAANAAGLTILLVEQNVKEAFSIVDTVMVLVNGTVRLVATPDEIRSRHDLHKLFLG